MFSLFRRGPGRLAPRQTRRRTDDGGAVRPDARETAERATAPHPPARLRAALHPPAWAGARLHLPVVDGSGARGVVA